MSTAATPRPRLLDLFCGAGGAAMGYHLAGFEVVGVDIRPQPRYPFTFVQAHALDVLGRDNLSPPRDHLFEPFDAVHASPPCQAYSALRARWKDREWPDLLGVTRDGLERLGLPYVIENVPGSPIRGTVMMCGGGLLPVVDCLDGRRRQVRRHRYFETNWALLGHPCWHSHPALGVYGHGSWANDSSDSRGGYQGSKAENAAGMGIDWMSQDELSQAIPPAYTLYVGEQLLEHLERRSSAALARPEGPSTRHQEVSV